MPLPAETQHPLQSLITALMQLTTSAGSGTAKRYYSFLFRDLPDRREYADYYILITEPRSLNGILDSMKKGIYSSPHAVAYDLFLVWNNAREYNQAGSMVYNDAVKLESYMQKLWVERTPPLPQWHSLMRPGPLGLERLPIDDSASSAKRIKLNVSKPDKHKHRDKTATGSRAVSPGSSRDHHGKKERKKEREREREREREPAAPMPMPLPRLKLSLGNSAAGPTPSTSATPAPPPVLAPITLKLSVPRPSTPAPTPPPKPTAPATVLVPVPASQPATPKPRVDHRANPADDGGAAAAAKREQKRERKAREKAAKLAAKLAADSEAAEPLLSMDKIVYTGIPDDESGWMGGEMGPNPVARYIDIIQKLRAHTDSSGRHLATPLLTLPDPATRPDYYKLVTNPIALDVIENRAKAGEYATPEAFDRDLHHLFQVARLFIRPETPGNVYADLVVLQRLYQELTKRVSHLSPPKTIAHGSLSSVQNGPGNMQPQNRASSPGTTGDSESKGHGSSRLALKDKILLNGVNFKGDLLRVGDWVHLLNPDNPAKPIIAQIFKVYRKPDSPQRYIHACWYYRPEETVHSASRQFYDHEVFKSGAFIEHSIEDFIERCFVMFFTKYVRGRPKAPAWKQGVPLYVCEHRYKEDVKTFKKIKSWTSSLPEEVRKHDYGMDLFPDEHVEPLHKVKSPFVRGIVGPGGIGEAVEHEEEEQAKYHFLPGGEPATVQKIKAVKDANDVLHAAAVAAEVAERAANPSTAMYGSEPHQSTAQSTPVRTAPPPPPAPVLPPPPPVDATLTPVELAAAKESFQPLPTFIQEKFRTNDKGDVLWFVAPPLALPPASKPHHSLDYLYWRAQRKAKQQTNGGMNGDDVEMMDVSGA